MASTVRDDSTLENLTGGQCEVYFFSKPVSLKTSKYFLELQTGIALSATSATFACSGTSCTYADIPYDSATYQYPVLKNNTKGEIVFCSVVGASGATFDITFRGRGHFFDKRKARGQRSTNHTYAVAWETSDEIQILGYYYDPRQAGHPVNVMGDVNFNVTPETSEDGTNSSGPVQTRRTGKTYEVTFSYAQNALPMDKLYDLLPDDSIVYNGADTTEWQWNDDALQNDILEGISLLIVPQSKIGVVDANSLQKLEDCIWLFNVGIDGNKSFGFTNDQQLIELTGKVNYSDVTESAWTRNLIGFNS